MPGALPRIVNLKRGPLDVRFTGEPIEALVHWVPESGRNGSYMPCLGADCAIHQLSRPRPIVLVAGVIRPKEAKPKVTEAEAERQKVHNFRQLPAEIQARLVGEARHLPALHGQGSTAPLSLLEDLAADLMWPAVKRAAVSAEWEAIVVDLPKGAADGFAELLDGQPWRGHRGLFLRAHVGAATSSRVLERPGAIALPDPFSVPERMAKHWGYPPECAHVELDDDGHMILTFATRAPTPYPRIAEGA